MAAPVPIANHSFETPDLTSGGNTWSNANIDWGDPDPGINDQFTEFIANFASEGQQHVGINATDTNNNGLVDPLVQDLAATYAPNTIYTLTVGVGNRNATFTIPGNESIFRLADAATGNVLAESIVDASTIPVGTFEDRSLVFTTGASGGPVGNGIRIVLANGPAGRSHFDNIRLDATVIPEPATMTLLLIAGIALASSGRLRR
jgi:hypothetical protein